MGGDWSGRDTMSDESLTAKTPALRASAFLDAEKNNDQHIVDTLIEERCPQLRSSWSWPLVRPVLYKLLGYSRAREMADTIMQLNGRDSFDHLSAQLDFSLDIGGWSVCLNPGASLSRPITQPVWPMGWPCGICSNRSVRTSSSSQMQMPSGSIRASRMSSSRWSGSRKSAPRPRHARP